MLNPKPRGQVQESLKMLSLVNKSGFLHCKHLKSEVLLTVHVLSGRDALGVKPSIIHILAFEFTILRVVELN